MLEVTNTKTPSFKTLPQSQMQRSTLPPQMQVQNRDMFELMEAKKKEQSKDRWQKAGIIGACVLAAAFATQAVIAVLSHKTNLRIAESTIKAADEQAKYFAKQNGAETKKSAEKLAKEVFEDISKADSVEKLSLSKDLEEFASVFKNSIDNPETVVERGGDFINSILFYGPPGTGKTTIAKAIAKMFPDAKFAVLDVTKMKDKYVGETEKNINALIDTICKEADDLYAKYLDDLKKVIDKKIVESGDETQINRAIAQAKAEGKDIPELKRIFVFADEIDSVMMVDTGSGAKISNDMLNEFKKGFTEKLGKRKNIVTMGATNLEIDAGKAMTADGKMLDKPMLDRFNMKIFVGNPTKEQLKQTIVRKLGDKALVADDLKNLDSEKLDKLCEFLEGSASFRDLNSILKITGNRVKKDAAGNIDCTAKTEIADVFNTIKSMQESLGFSDEALNNLATKIGLVV